MPIRDENNGRFLPTIYDLSPTRDLGYLCGVIFGDGYIENNINASSPNRIIVGSTIPDTILKWFIDCASRLGFHTVVEKPYIYKRESLRRNKTVYTYKAGIYAKHLHDVLLPFKHPDYHWDIPSFLTTEESMWGFMGGLFDAEGCIVKDPRYKCGIKVLSIVSKHKTNLEPVHNWLKEHDVDSSLYFYPHRKLLCHLNIRTKASKELFLSQIPSNKWADWVKNNDFKGF